MFFSSATIPISLPPFSISLPPTDKALQQMVISLHTMNISLHEMTISLPYTDNASGEINISLGDDGATEGECENWEM